MLDALRDGIGAEALGLFDDDRGDRAEDAAEASPAAGEPNFWEAFDGLPCAEVDWRSWYRRLRQDGQVESTCSCGQAHRLSGYLIHDRWALLLVTSHTWQPGAAAAVSSSVKLLSDKLPPAHRRDPLAVELQARFDAEAPDQQAPGSLWGGRKVK